MIADLLAYPAVALSMWWGWWVVLALVVLVLLWPERVR